MAEMALAGNIGFTTYIAPGLPPLVGLYFGEDQGRYLVTVKDHKALVERAGIAQVDAVPIGMTGGSDCTFQWIAEDRVQKVPLTALREASDSFFRDWMEA
jgi:phosphoribosylformylglycinamidine synthase